VILRIRAFLRKAGTEKQRLNVNEIIQEVIDLAHTEIRKKGVMLRTEPARDLPPVLGDRVQLQQVLLNLMINGVEAMSGIEDRSRELVVATYLDEADQVCVTVQDTGTGLEPQNMERIFDAFYTTKPDGMGMGLSISKSIINAHNGRLWAARNDGPGATFQFALPAQRE
jgi:signal transduction histidine kinase